MSATLCSVCGAVLRGGACPNGHPQRSSRRRERRSRRGLWATIVLLIILGAAAYGGLILYPRTAAGDLMVQSSEEFSRSLIAYRSTTGAFPPGSTDPQALADIAAAILGSAQEAKSRLSDASIELEEREAVEVPVISGRPPLSRAIGVRDQMLTFYVSAREVIASLEAIAGYIGQVSGTLDQVQALENTVNAAKAVDPGPAVNSAIPVADQLLADLRAITPPDELGALHASLLGIAERIRQGFDDVTAAAGGGRQTVPVVAANLQSIRDEIATFKETLGGTPRLSRRAGLAAELQAVDELAVRITEGLTALREQGVEDITLPGE